MNINKIINELQGVTLYEKGTHTMWTDEYISKQLLEMHLNPNVDIASRSSENIESTVNYILKNIKCEKASILDLGCGPGLYTEKLAEKRHKVTGVDFSKNSINYAKNRLKENGLQIDYVCDNYLNLDYDNKFDLIIMIYCDFGVLSLEERNTLIKKIYKALKKGGVFIFDTLNENSLSNMKFESSWEFSSGGFWSDKPYLALSQSKHFKENKAILDEHIVINEVGEHKIYRFWNHYLNYEEVNAIFQQHNFSKIEVKENIISSDNPYNNVYFFKITK